MSDDHTITAVGNKWHVEFKRRCFSREYDSEETARTVVAADVVLTEAQNVGLYTTIEVGTTKRTELAANLRQAAVELHKVGIEDFTIRMFMHAADTLHPKEG